MKPRRLKSFRAILFDCGGTLAVYQPAREKIFTSALKEAGHTVPLRHVVEAYRSTGFWLKLSSVKIKTAEGRLDFYDTFHKKICEYLCLSSAADEVNRRLRQKFAAEHCRWTAAPGSIALLKAIAQNGVPAGIVANWDRSLNEKCLGFGFLPYLKFVIASAAVGVEKPSPGIFKAALRQLGLEGSPSSVLYLGDDYRLDVLGAAGAGLETALIDPDDQHPGADCRRYTSLKKFLNAMNFTRDKEPSFKL